MSDAREIERCRAEILSSEAQLRSRHPETEGLCLALADWSAELRMIQGNKRVKAKKPAKAKAKAGRADGTRE